MASLGDGTGADYREKSLMPAGAKGGVGKSTLAAQVASEASRFGLRVAGIDLDANGALSAMSGTVAAEGEPSIRDVLEGTKTPLEVARVPSLWQPRTDLSWEKGGALIPGGLIHIVPAPQSGLEKATNRSGTEAESSLSLAISQSRFGDNYDLIIIDAPGTEGPAFQLGMHAAGQLVFPLQTETLALRGLIRTIEAAINFGVYTGKPVNAIGVVATMVKNNSENRGTLEEAARYLQERFNGAIPVLPPLPQRTIVSEAVPAGVPVSRMVTSSNSDVAFGYTRIALSVLAAVCSEERFGEIMTAVEAAEISDRNRAILFSDNYSAAPVAAS